MNIIGFSTLIKKECARFFSVYLQTIVAPVMTTFLFYVVFTTVFSGTRAEVFGFPFVTFLAPGLVMMGMAQNSFANSSSSLIVSKMMQSNLSDILMAPLTPFVILSGYVVGAVIRGLIIGFLSVFVLMFFLHIPVSSLAVIMVFSFLGCTLLALLGFIGGIWAEKFDHLSAFTNFVITPLTFLSGTFFSIENIAPFWQKAAQFNPFFYMIDGFRHGFLGVGDSNLYVGAAMLIVCNIVLWAGCQYMLHVGYKIKS